MTDPVWIDPKETDTSARAKQIASTLGREEADAHIAKIKKEGLDHYHEGVCAYWPDYCEGNTKFVKYRSAATAYSWDGVGPDPNGPILLCDSCYEEYTEHWKEQWDAYYDAIGPVY